ncbi:MAG: O-methyltransferase [Phycisphaerales bacterium]|nr:MAG: O-methyltransferase [Phycisphaerales bacterium]
MKTVSGKELGMLKKTTFWILVAFTLVGVAVLVAQEGPGGRMRRGGGGPGGQGRFMGPQFGEWFNEISAAYEKNDREQMGRLIAEMKPRIERMQAGTGRPGGGPPPGMGRFPRGGGEQSSLDSSPLAKNDAEKKILGVLNDMNSSQRRGMMNVPVADGRLLRLLAETLGARHVVEIGTSNGYSGIWFCLALQKSGGRLTTHEIDARRASLARENFKRAGVDKLVTLVEGDAHETVKKLKDQIDILFLDADKEGYIDYLQKLLPLVRPGGLIVAHNIGPGRSDPRYIEAITTNPDLETVLYQQGGGVSITLKKR